MLPVVVVEVRLGELRVLRNLQLGSAAIEGVLLRRTGAIERLLAKSVFGVAHFTSGIAELVAAGHFAAAKPFEDVIEILAQTSLLAGKAFAATVLRIACALSFT